MTLVPRRDPLSRRNRRDSNYSAIQATYPPFVLCLEDDPK